MAYASRRWLSASSFHRREGIFCARSHPGWLSKTAFPAISLGQVIVDWRGPLARAEGEEEVHVCNALA